MRGMGRLGNEVGGHLHLENLKFSKTGKEIQISVTRLQSDISSEVEKKQSLIGEICKRREMDPAEVLDAGDDQEKVETYSNKVLSNAPQTNVVLKALQEDLNSLRNHTVGIMFLQAKFRDLERVRVNLDPNHSFSLNFAELCSLGF